MTTAFPETLGLAPDRVEALLVTVGQAPSLHNAQPWRLRLEPAAIELYADPERRLPAVDPEDRELRMGCGAALYNLRLALLAYNRGPYAVQASLAAGQDPANGYETAVMQGYRGRGLLRD